MTDTATLPLARAAGTGPATWAMGSLFEHLLTGPESGGELGVSLVTQPPGTATPCTGTPTRARRSTCSRAR
ncbi:hypothetical protein ASD06_03020 [Angustibacter sp. Root456]|nr:hypothetical protein ASD06_03020 [Angustibacter sp. Root456]